MLLAFSASSSLVGWRPERTICWCHSSTSFSTSGQLPKRSRDPDSWGSPSRRAYLGDSECDTVDCEMVWLYMFSNHSMQALCEGRTVCELAHRRRARRWSSVSECRSLGPPGGGGGSTSWADIIDGGGGDNDGGDAFPFVHERAGELRERGGAVGGGVQEAGGGGGRGGGSKPANKTRQTRGRGGAK